MSGLMTTRARYGVRCDRPGRNVLYPPRVGDGTLVVERKRVCLTCGAEGYGAQFALEHARVPREACPCWNVTEV